MDEPPTGGKEAQHGVPPGAASLLRRRDRPQADHLPFAGVFTPESPPADVDHVSVEDTQRRGNPSGKLWLSVYDTAQSGMQPVIPAGSQDPGTVLKRSPGRSGIEEEADTLGASQALKGPHWPCPALRTPLGDNRRSAAAPRGEGQTQYQTGLRWLREHLR